MKVLHVVPSMSRVMGGLASSVAGQADALSMTGLDLCVLTSRDCETADMVDHEGSWRLIRAETGPMKSLVAALSDGFADAASDLLSEHQLLHAHGIWVFPVVKAQKAAWRKQRPVILSVHGMLMPWAVSHRAWKKRLAWMLYQRKAFAKAAYIHVSSEAEADSVRNWVPRAKIAVIPHGVVLPVIEGRTVNERRRRRRAVFLGRLHPVKGLEPLLEAWATLRPKEWELVIAGPDEAGYAETLERKIHALDLANDCRLAGEVRGAGKWALLAEADLVVQPSYSENFGMTIAEALAAAKPVITTRATPWAEIEDCGCGWWIAPELGPLRDALTDAFRRKDSELEAMGQAGRRLIENRYSWSVVAQSFDALYQQVISESD